MSVSDGSTSDSVVVFAGRAAAEVRTNLRYWRHALVRLEGIKVQVEERLSGTLVGLRTETTASEGSAVSQHSQPATAPPTCEGDGAGKNSPPNRSMICSSATSLVGVTLGGGGTGGPFLSCQKSQRESDQLGCSAPRVQGRGWSHMTTIRTGQH